MRTSVFAFFFGLGTSAAALLAIGLPTMIALQVVAVLAVFTLGLAGLVGLVTGEFRRPAELTR